MGIYEFRIVLAGSLILAVGFIAEFGDVVQVNAGLLCAIVDDKLLEFAHDGIGQLGGNERVLRGGRYGDNVGLLVHHTIDTTRYTLDYLVLGLGQLERIGTIVFVGIEMFDLGETRLHLQHHLGPERSLTFLRQVIHIAALERTVYRLHLHLHHRHEEVGGLNQVGIKLRCDGIGGVHTAQVHAEHTSHAAKSTHIAATVGILGGQHNADLIIARDAQHNARSEGEGEHEREDVPPLALPNGLEY